MIKHFSRILVCLRNTYAGSRSEFYAHISKQLEEKRGGLIVTANPETLAQAEREDYLHILEDPRTQLVADGIGLIKMAQTAGISIPERLAGVELMDTLLTHANQTGLSVAFLGASQEVLTALIEKLHKEKPDLNVVFSEHGYQPDKDVLMAQVAAAAPALLFVALGIPTQEELIYRHLDDLPHTICIGVGGSFDVLSGKKRRAPRFFIRTNTEWLYRILREPKRLKRFFQNNILFYRRWKRACRDL